MDARYERDREYARNKRSEITAAGQEIGPLPGVANKRRRARCEKSFRKFCETYFSHVFSLKWSDDHIKVIGKIETAVLRGGLFGVAMPRGSGKTSLAEIACLWALLIAERVFVLLIGSDEKSAVSMLNSLKGELEANELLAADFPEVCYPIHALEGSARRCEGQRQDGTRTQITWKEKEIVLPTIADSRASSGIVRVTGLTGHFRGMKFKRSDGKSVRPDLVIVDDPQTDESARSPSQCGDRESVLSGAVLGLAGPGKKISGIMPCTVIRPDDLADRMLNRKLHPEWQGERTKMVYRFPTAVDLWEKYGELRAESLRNGNDGREATEFYRKRRKKMDAGSKVAWPERFNEDEISAIQNAMNMKLRDEAAFFAEFQNEPLPDQTDDDDLPTVDDIAGKFNRLPRLRAAIDVSRLTAFIDVQKKLLWYCVCGWSDGFTGYVIDYGTWPDQKRNRFTLNDARITLAHKFPKAGLEGQIFGGLEELTAQILGAAYQRDDGAELKIDRCLVDANWGESTDVVYQFCRQSQYAGVILPSHGKGITASNVPMIEYKRKKGERLGYNWRIPAVTGKRQVRHVLYDTNFWKTFMFRRLAVPIGDAGCLSLFGRARHQLFAEQLHAEYPVKTEGRGRTLLEWKARPNHPDNHWFDCLVGNGVAASMCGISLQEVAGVKQPPAAGSKRRKKVSYLS